VPWERAVASSIDAIQAEAERRSQGTRRH